MKKMIYENMPERMVKLQEEYVNEGGCEDDAYDAAWNYIDDEYHARKEIIDNQTKYPIICFASIGRWDGTVYGYKIISKKESVFDVLTEDYNSLYIESEELKGDGIHHDGRNHYWFRKIACNEDELEELEDVIYSNALKSRQVELLLKYTKPVKIRF